MPRDQLGGFLNSTSYQLLRQALWQSVRTGDAATRRIMGMKPLSFFGPFASLQRRSLVSLYGYSAHVLPRPYDWDSRQHVTGYWFLEAASDWNPPSDLLDFLHSGPAPIYIGFGSMGNRDPQATTRIALEALARSGQRGVLVTGWGGLGSTDQPDTVYMLKSAPHS